MIFKSATQPFCRVCGKPIRKHVRRVWIEKQTRPGVVTGEFSRHVVGEARTKADCARFTNLQVLSIQRAINREFIFSFTEWDGESYVSEFFCTGSCAQAMGHAACRDHNLSTKRWAAAMATEKGLNLLKGSQ